jgi:hypothetical protein
MNRRTKVEIEVAKAKEAMIKMGLDPASEDGEKYLKNVRDKYRAKLAKTNPDLSAAKKRRQKAKSALMTLNRAANTVMNLSIDLYEEKVDEAREAMEQANLDVKMLDGNDMPVVTEYLDEYMAILKSKEESPVE